MDHIYADANEKWVKNTVVYTNGDGYAYLDQECTVKATKEQLTNLFMKGVIIDDCHRNFANPTACNNFGKFCELVNIGNNLCSAEWTGESTTPS